MKLVSYLTDAATNTKILELDRAAMKKLERGVKDIFSRYQKEILYIVIRNDLPDKLYSVIQWVDAELASMRDALTDSIKERST